MGNKFYKFIEPSFNQKCYKKGDSWTEELCISRKTFTRAFDEIGVRYKSKRDFDEAIDKFQGKLYASYYNRQTKKTFFLKNTEISTDYIECQQEQKESHLTVIESKNAFNNVSASCENSVQNEQNFIQSDLIEDCSEIQQKKDIKTSDVDILTDNELNVESNSKESSKGSKKTSNTNESDIFFNDNIPLYNGQNDRSGYIYKYIYITKTTPTKSTSNFKNKDEDLDQSELVKIIKSIWRETIGDDENEPIISSKAILKSFKEVFNNSIEVWKTYCAKIASSDFLMGKVKTTFKMWISWALKKETYDRINSGELGILKEEPIKTIVETNEVLDSILSNHSEKNIQDSFREISKRIEPVRFNSWFKEIKLHAIDGKTAFLKVKDRLSSDYIRRNFYSELSFCFNKFNPNVRRIEIFS